MKHTQNEQNQALGATLALGAATQALEGPESVEHRLTIRELARLGRCHPLTVRRAIWAGTLPAERRGGVGPYLIRQSDAETWLGGR